MRFILRLLEENGGELERTTADPFQIEGATLDDAIVQSQAIAEKPISCGFFDGFEICDENNICLYRTPYPQNTPATDGK